MNVYRRLPYTLDPRPDNARKPLSGRETVASAQSPVYSPCDRETPYAHSVCSRGSAFKFSHIVSGVSRWDEHEV